MTQFFKYVEIATTQNPMDFSYKFGFNDNAPDKFCYTDTLTNFGSMFSQQSQSFKNNASNDLISFDSMLNDNEELNSFTILSPAYEVKNQSLLNISRMEHMKSINFKTMIKQTAITATTQAWNITMSGLAYASNNYNVYMNNFKEALFRERPVGQYEFAKTNQNAYNKAQNSQNMMDGLQLAQAIIGLGASISSLSQTIVARNTKTETEAMIDSKIASINEAIASNREFMQQAQAEIDRRNRRKR